MMVHAFSFYTPALYNNLLPDVRISEFGVPAVNLNIASDWERIGTKMTR